MKMKMKMKIKIAVVGCGRIATKHFEAIQQHSNNLDLVAVCDINKDVLTIKNIDLISSMDIIKIIEKYTGCLKTKNNIH